MAIQLRRATSQDVTQLAIVRQRSWDSAYRGIYADSLIDNFDYLAHEKRFLKQLHDSSTFVFAIDTSNEIIGFFILSISAIPVYKDFSVCLNSLYILPEYHHQGIGTRVMRFAKEWCQERGYHGMYNSCNPHNKRACRFYEAMGGVVGAADEGNDDLGADQWFYEYQWR